LLDGSSITNSGSSVSLTLRGRLDTSSYTIQRVSLVKRDAQTLDGVDATWEPVTFGGDWNSGATVPSGGTITSDPVAFDVAVGEDVFLTYWVADGQGTVLRKIASETSTWTINGSDQSSIIDWQALTISDSRRQVFSALRLDVLAGPP